MRGFIRRIEEKATLGKGISQADAVKVLSVPPMWLFELLGSANRVREQFKGDEVRLCSIVNAKSGLCSEDCSFCSQSKVSTAPIEKYPLLAPDEMVRRAKEAREGGAGEFSIVTSGVALKSLSEVKKLGEALTVISSEIGLETCVSAGAVKGEHLAYLKERGLTSFHHNLETSRSFFPQICTTHPYEEDVKAVREAKAAGLWVCSGGIFGLGESDGDRVELAFTLKELDVDSIPLNFLNPIEGTPLQGKRDLTPFICLKIIAMMRLVNPEKEIIVCGGREVNLRDMQSLMFAAGANGTMLGNYLTTKGRSRDEDLRMIEDLGLRVKAKREGDG